jgi:hypothetical protein
MTRMARSPQRGAPALLWLIGLLSLFLNIVLIGALIAGWLSVRGFAKTSVDELEALGNSTIATTVRIADRGLPINATVPINFTHEVAINQRIPINEVLPIRQTVPLLGEVAFDVPVSLDIPVNVTVPITISRQVEISTTIQANSLEVPVAVQIRDTPLKQQIDTIVKLLRNVAGQ